MKSMRGWIGCASCILILTAYADSSPPEYEMTRSTIAGGGVMRSHGGEFQLSSTVGQADAGEMSGGEFDLTGGFWFPLSPTDCNEDGLVSLLDHEVFTVCLLGPNGGIGADPCPCLDVDGDGDVTLNDYARLQAGFTGQ